MILRSRLVRFAGVVTAALTVVTACGGSNKSATTTTTASHTSSTVSNSYALQYTAGTPGRADPSKTPVTIGYVNEEGGVLSFPEATQGADAAVAYVNDELGGVGGHRLVLEKCVVQTEEDGQKCGVQLANDPAVSLVLTGTLEVGSQSLYSVLAGKKPVIVSNPVVAPDFTTKGVTALTPGSPGVIEGLAVLIAKNLPNVHRVAAIYVNDPLGTIAFNSLFKPLLAKLGVTDVTGVPVSATATATDYQQALQASGASKADVVVPLVAVQGCIAAYDAMQALGIKPVVVTSGLCFGTPMTKHLQNELGLKDQVPDGWYFAGYGYSYFIPNAESGMDTYLAKIHQYGPPDVEYTGFAGPVFASVLSAVKFMNAAGVGNLTSSTINGQIAGFTGPQMLVVGPIHCGGNPLFPALCGTEMGVEQYKNRQWVPVADGYNNMAIDPSKY